MEEECVLYKVGVITAIKGMQTEKYRVLLYERYINYKSFRVIARIMGYSYDYILELHAKSLDEFGKIPYVSS
jgi:hypothetical protein